jgi:hypothetical protein
MTHSLLEQEYMIDILFIVNYVTLVTVGGMGDREIPCSYKN